MTVVSSFAAADIDPDRLRSAGAQMLSRYLTYAESGGSNLGDTARDKPDLNPFERDVETQLSAAGIPLIAQYGCSGYWIDFAAQHPTRPGRMVLAIECDGATYHSSATTRDRDRLRQEHLERLGWTFHRLWSQDWFYHREAEIARALAAYRATVTAADDNVSVESPREPITGHMGSHAGPGPQSPAGRWLTGRTGRCPIATHRSSIDEYTPGELATVVRWIESDTLLRTEEELLAETMRTLGFTRKGSKITAALTDAIALSRNRATRQW